MPDATDAVQLLEVSNRSLTVQIAGIQYEVPCDYESDAFYGRGPFYTRGGYGGDPIAVEALDSLDEDALLAAMRAMWSDPERPAPITLYPVPRLAEVA